MLDVLREDYVRTAFAKGLPERLVVVRHALRNALIPALTVIGTSVGALLGGAVVTETVFTIPGMGRLVVQSIARRDYPVIQGAVMAIAMTYVLVNLIVDMLYVYVDPRVRLGRRLMAGDDSRRDRRSPALPSSSGVRSRRRRAPGCSRCCRNPVTLVSARSCSLMALAARSSPRC